MMLVFGCQSPTNKAGATPTPPTAVEGSMVTLELNPETGQIITTNRNEYGIVGFVSHVTNDPSFNLVILQENSAGNPKKKGVIVTCDRGLKAGDPVMIEMVNIIAKEGSSGLQFTCIRINVERWDTSREFVLGPPVRFYGNTGNETIFRGKGYIQAVGIKGEVIALQDDSAGASNLPGIIISELPRIIKNGGSVICRITYMMAKTHRSPSGEVIDTPPYRVFKVNINNFVPLQRGKEYLSLR